MDTYFDPDLNPNPQIQFYIIDMKKGDVTGDGVIDEVYLLGTQPSGVTGPDYYDNITISIIDGKTKKTTFLRFKYNAGNNPKLILNDFTGNGINDIFISITQNILNGQSFYYLFSAIDNNPKSLFNFLSFNEYSQYSVIYKDQYKVNIYGLKSNEEFILDISLKPKEYLSSIYSSDGKLLYATKGDVLPLGYLYPIDINTDGAYELLAMQKIVGVTKTDVIGYIQTVLHYNGTEFIPGLTFLVVGGKKIPLPTDVK
ncbi:MAG: VCBS repeat-containing protein [Clostridium sp.]